MWHVREFAPTQRISRGTGPVMPLPSRATPADLGSIGLSRVDGSQAVVADVLAETFTDGFVVAHGGKLVFESYAPGGGPKSPHAVPSITKSVVGCVRGILLDQGVLVEDRDVAEYLPELAGSGYAGRPSETCWTCVGASRSVRTTSTRTPMRRMDHWIPGRDERHDQGPYRRSLCSRPFYDREHRRRGDASRRSGTVRSLGAVELTVSRWRSAGLRIPGCPTAP